MAQKTFAKSNMPAAVSVKLADISKRQEARQAAQSASPPIPHGPPEPKKPKYEDLPLVSVLPRKAMDEAIALMHEDVAIAEQVAAFNKRRGEIKGELALLASKYEKVSGGMRHGRVVVYNNGWKSRWTLDKKLLIENLVTPEQIKASMKEGKKSLDLRVVDLDKRKDDPREESSESDD